MRIPRPTVTLVAALTLASSVGAAPRTNRVSEPAPMRSQELLDRLARAELLAGITEVTGPGLIVTLRHSPRPLKGVDPEALLIRDQDLNGVLNALRVAGAEALAVTGASQQFPERILVTSAATSAGDGVLINGNKLRPPYRILAVGSGDAMRTELFRPDGVVKKAGLDTLQMIELESAAALVIPASRKTSEPKFARLPDPTAAPSQPAAKPEVSLPTASNSTPMATPNRVIAVIPRAKVATAPLTPKVTLPTPEPAPEPVRPKPEVPVAKVEPPSAKPEPELSKPVPAPRTAAKPATTPTSVPLPAADLGLFGGKGLAKYHAAGCRFGERIQKGERVFFASPEAARQVGRVPCSICLPDATVHSASH